jgi:hypothetical protein
MLPKPKDKNYFPVSCRPFGLSYQYEIGFPSNINITQSIPILLNSCHAHDGFNGHKPDAKFAIAAEPASVTIT